MLSTCTGLSPSKARLSFRFQFLHSWHWPNPRSLATTSGVSVDVLSSRYLDVSVPWVCFHTLWIHVRIWPKPGVAPFGNLRIKACSQLPEAYRSVPRPSSPLSAKASIECPYFTSLLSLSMSVRARRPYVHQSETDRANRTRSVSKKPLCLLRNSISRRRNHAHGSSRPHTPYGACVDIEF